MALCTHGPSAGRPNHLAARYSRTEQFWDNIDRATTMRRRAEVASWEAEWIADGTIQPGGLYQPFVNGKPSGEPKPFVDAMLAVWPAGSSKPVGEIRRFERQSQDKEICNAM